jgi:hypothetical protein
MTGILPSPSWQEFDLLDQSLAANPIGGPAAFQSMQSLKIEDSPEPLNVTEKVLG